MALPSSLAKGQRQITVVFFSIFLNRRTGERKNDNCFTRVNYGNVALI